MPDAQRRVLVQLDHAYERHAIREQKLRLAGRFDDAEVHHEMCVRILRARIAEEDAARTPLEPAHDCVICSDRLHSMMRRYRAEP